MVQIHFFLNSCKSKRSVMVWWIGSTNLWLKISAFLYFILDDERMDYTIRDLIPMHVWPKMPDLPSKGNASKILIKSQCRNGSLVIDGGCAYNFNTGTSAILETDQKYVLKTIKFFDDV